jgi:Asp-tRNA(Asn)/Glu-tRNA(Gln) amidotransferase A subunit family amidase
MQLRPRGVNERRASASRVLIAQSFCAEFTIHKARELSAIRPVRVAWDDVRVRSQALLCIAGLAGLPQVSLPWLDTEDGLVGLSLIGPHGADAMVLGAAQRVAQQLRAF